MAKLAKVVATDAPRKVHKTLKGQSQLGEYARGRAEESADPYKASVLSGQGSTRAFPSFPLGKATILDKFQEWLCTVEGKQRTPAQAREIAVDVSKALW